MHRGDGENEGETYWQKMREAERRGRAEEVECKSERD